MDLANILLPSKKANFLYKDDDEEDSFDEDGKDEYGGGNDDDDDEYDSTGYVDEVDFGGFEE